MNELISLYYLVIPEPYTFSSREEIGHFDDIKTERGIEHWKVTGSIRYYHSPNEDDKSFTDAMLAADYERAMEFEDGSRNFVGVKAFATFGPANRNGITTPLLANTESCGLWGIEVRDGNPDDIKYTIDVAKEEFENLRIGLKDMGVDLPSDQWSTLLQKAVDKEFAITERQAI